MYPGPPISSNILSDKRYISITYPRCFRGLESVKWVKMKPLDRVEALLASLAREPKTFYALYRTTPGCAYTSLKNAIKELKQRGLIEEIREEKIGGERRIYRVTEKGRKLLQTLITETPTVSITDVKV